MINRLLISFTLSQGHALEASKPFVWTLSTSSGGNIGLPSRNISTVCAQLYNQIQELVIDPVQLREGILQDTLVENDCSKLQQLDLLANKEEEDQIAICSNSCFGTMADLYGQLLIENCFQDQADAREAANGRMYAGSFRLACQQTTALEYCVPLMGLAVSELQPDSFDVCDDVVSEWQCCFGNYRALVAGHGTPEMVAAIDKVARDCDASSLPEKCPCANNVFPGPPSFLAKGDPQEQLPNPYQICAAMSMMRCPELFLCWIITTFVLLWSSF